MKLKDKSSFDIFLCKAPKKNFFFDSTGLKQQSLKLHKKEHSKILSIQKYQVIHLKAVIEHKN